MAAARTTAILNVRFSIYPGIPPPLDAVGQPFILPT
jgi:hypothetical protein